MAPIATSNPIPDRSRRVTPALVVNGGVKALEFYAQVFGATERMRFPGPGGTVACAEIEIGDSVVIVEEASAYMSTQAPPTGGLEGTTVFLFLYVEDLDAVIARAVKLGATLKRPAQDQFYGDRDGFIIDPFGHGWTIASQLWCRIATPGRPPSGRLRPRQARGQAPLLPSRSRGARPTPADT